ncbi:hypothetical protein ACIU1J_01275 [Azospirillum doebereinerae]
MGPCASRHANSPAVAMETTATPASVTPTILAVRRIKDGPGPNSGQSPG